MNKKNLKITTYLELNIKNKKIGIIKIYIQITFYTTLYTTLPLNYHSFKSMRKKLKIHNLTLT